MWRDSAQTGVRHIVEGRWTDREQSVTAQLSAWRWLPSWTESYDTNSRKCSHCRRHRENKGRVASQARRRTACLDSHRDRSRGLREYLKGVPLLRQPTIASAIANQSSSREGAGVAEGWSRFPSYGVLLVHRSLTTAPASEFLSGRPKRGRAAAMEQSSRDLNTRSASTRAPFSCARGRAYLRAMQSHRLPDVRED